MFVLCRRPATEKAGILLVTDVYDSESAWTLNLLKIRLTFGLQQFNDAAMVSTGVDWTKTIIMGRLKRGETMVQMVTCCPQTLDGREYTY